MDANVIRSHRHYRLLTCVGLLCSLLAMSGCTLMQPAPSSMMACDATACDSQIDPMVPRELDKVTMPMYRIEPPDILSIDVAQQVSQLTYELQAGDIVALTVLGTFPDEPIAGEFQVLAGGVIELGFGYGAVEIGGCTVAQAVELIEVHLRAQLREPQVSLSLLDVGGMQQISGEHLVGADGTITLGQYGTVSVVGMTLEEGREAIANHLSKYFAKPRVSVSVFSFNSKAYYVITQGGGLGDSLVRLPFTGNETVLDALSQINGTSYVSSSEMWLARPNRDSGVTRLPIDWQGITQNADVATNYQLLPGDRIFIAHNRWVAFDTQLAKFTSPLERILGFTLLGTGRPRDCRVTYWAGIARLSFPRHERLRKQVLEPFRTPTTNAASLDARSCAVDVHRLSAFRFTCPRSATTSRDTSRRWLLRNELGPTHDSGNAHRV